MSNSTAANKNTWLFLLFSISCLACNNSSPEKKPGKQPGAYEFRAPKGWVTEKIAFPIKFAPQINYKGFEDLRFAPGWEFTTSDEHWSYTFLWWLEGNIELDTAVLKEHLENYYFGLLSSNVRDRHIPANKVIRPTVAIRKTETVKGDIETYTGTITMVNYLNIAFPTLAMNCMINKKNCNPNTAIVFQVSPQPFSHKVWRQLNEIGSNFECRLK